MAVPTEKADITMVDDRSVDRIDAEKGPNVQIIDNIRVLGLTDDDANFYLNFPEEARKKIFRKVRHLTGGHISLQPCSQLRKVDARLIPMLAVLYLISHLDRKSNLVIEPYKIRRDIASFNQTNDVCNRRQYWECEN
jgi:hypothetical protein